MRDRGGQLPKPLRVYLAVLLSLTAVSWLDAGQGFVRFGKPGLAYLWMYYPGFDFVDYTLQFPYLHTAKFFTLPVFPWVYPAPAIFVLYPFYKIVLLTNRAIGFVVFALVIVAADGFVMLRFAKALEQRFVARGDAWLLVLATSLCGWPLYFALQRGNIESLLWLGVAAGVWCYSRRQYAAAATLFGVVGSVKLYPLLFLGLLLRPRRFRELWWGAAAAVGTTLLALRFLMPDVAFAWHQIEGGIQRWTAITATVYLPTGIGVDHSAFGLLKQVTLGGVLRHPHALNWYLAGAAMVCSALFLGRVLFLPRPNQVLFLTCATVLLPPTSFDYTLVSMLIPWGWLVILCVERARAGLEVREFVLPFCLLGIVLAPLTFMHSHSGSAVYVEGAVRSAALLALLFLAAIVPLGELHPAE